MKYNWKKLQDTLDNKSVTLMFHQYYEKRFNSLEELIIFAIDSSKSQIPDTLSVSKKTGKKRYQFIGSSRSLHDLYLLAKTYYPNTTVKDVIEVLSRNDYRIKTWYCSTFGKRMFSISRYGDGFLRFQKNKIAYFN